MLDKPPTTVSDRNCALQLLAGLTPAQFMRKHWQKRPLLVRQAIADFQPPVGRRRLFELASCADVESRLIEHVDGRWNLTLGPMRSRTLPPLRRPCWTVLVQGVDRHDDAARALLDRYFAFIPAARLDDLMISYASEHGGVGPHVDQYDVFLLQAHGQRRWRIGQPDAADFGFIPDVPLKILANFEPQQEFVLDPGDMLYLPPNWAHEGTAVGGDCITYSVGFRAPARHELAVELLSRIADAAASAPDERRYRDPAQPAVSNPAAIPPGLANFAQQTVTRALQGHGTVMRALGELLSEPHASVWFEAREPAALQPPLRLDRRSRMLYDDGHVYLNGESRAATGRDARLLQRLANQRTLEAGDLRHCSEALCECLREWMEAGWLHASDRHEPQGNQR